MVERAFPTEGETHGVLIKISVKNFVAYSAGVHRSRELLHRHPVELGIKNLGFMGALFLFFFYESFYVRLFSHTQLAQREDFIPERSIFIPFQRSPTQRTELLACVNKDLKLVVGRCSCVSRAPLRSRRNAHAG